jgi:hypothetical protein
VRSKDAWEAIRLFAKSPVGGLQESYRLLEAARAMQIGITFAVIYELTFLIGMYLMASRAAGLFGFGISVSDASVGTLLKLLIAGIVPFGSLAAGGMLARKIFHGTGVWAGDVYTAGAALLPLGIAVLLTALVGPANFELVAAVFTFALCYAVLMLYAGCTRVAAIPEAGAAPSVPLMLVVAAWLTKVILVALL